MVYRFLLLSDEVDNFKREIQISSQATFLDLHKEILKSTGYDTDQMYSFFVCGEDWSKQTEITLIEMDTSSEEDCYIMDSTVLDDILEEEHQKLLYVFDPLNDRVLFIELREIITGKELKDPICTVSVGKAPNQIIDFDIVANDIISDLDEDFYGDDEYNDEDLAALDEGSFDDSSPGDDRL